MKKQLLSTLAAGLMLCGVSQIKAMDNSDLFQNNDSTFYAFNVDTNELPEKADINVYTEQIPEFDFDKDMGEFYDSNEGYNIDPEKPAKKAKLINPNDDIFNLEDPIFNLEDPNKWDSNLSLAVPKTALTPLTSNNDNNNNKRQIKWSINNDHVADKPFKCTVPGCGQSFHVSSSVYVHINREHTHNRQYSCHFCAAYRQEAKDKPQETKNKNTKKCHLVEKIYYDAPNFLKHLRSHTRPYQCNFPCLETYPARKKLEKHQEKKHGVTNNDAAPLNNTFPCHLCGKEGLNALPSHKAECRTLLACVLTSLSIPASEANLAKIGFNDDNYATEVKCPTCSATFKNRIGLAHHMTLKGHNPVITPLTSNTTALLPPSPAVLALKNTNQSNDRITNAQNDPSHQPNFQTPVIQPASEQPKNSKTPEAFSYDVKKTNPYETEWTKL